MAKQDIIQDVLDESPNRRRLLKKLGIASAAVAAGASVTSNKLQAQSGAPAASDVVQFALNLEYLEAEFYSVATTGKTIEARGYAINGQGNQGPTITAYGQVNFANNLVLTSATAQDIATDEINHVQVLRAALTAYNITPVAKPTINLDALASAGASLANEQSFLILARIFEDIGVSAYTGGAPYLSGSPYLQTAARILAVEGEHVGNIRLEVARLGIPSPQLDPADVVPPPTGSNFFSTNLANGLPAFRTPGQVLYLAYGAANVTAGGFFPNGVNGVLNMSSGPATAANLN